MNKVTYKDLLLASVGFIISSLNTLRYEDSWLVKLCIALSIVFIVINLMNKIPNE